MDTFEEIRSLMEDNPQTPLNSMRYRVNQKIAVMFKVSWIYTMLPDEAKRQFQSATFLKSTLKVHRDFVVAKDLCHLKETLRSNMESGRLARLIVDQLFQTSEQSSISLLFKKLPHDARTQLKSVEGLEGFIKFYPSLFHLQSSSMVKLASEPLMTNVIKPIPNSRGAANAAQRKQLTSLPGLAHEKGLSTLFVFQNIEKPFFKVHNINQNLLKKLKSATLMVVIHNHAGLRDSLENSPCEKSVCLEILRAKTLHNGISNEDVFSKLSPQAQQRVRSSDELDLFVTLHSDFFDVPDNDNHLNNRVTKQELSLKALKFREEFMEMAPIENYDDSAILDL